LAFRKFGEPALHGFMSVEGGVRVIEEAGFRRHIPELICRFVEIHVGVEVPGSQISPPGDGPAVGHLENPESSGPFRSVKRPAETMY
jgi:hypothetical protein